MKIFFWLSRFWRMPSAPTRSSVSTPAYPARCHSHTAHIGPFIMRLGVGLQDGHLFGDGEVVSLRSLPINQQTVWKLSPTRLSPSHRSGASRRRPGCGRRGFGWCRLPLFKLVQRPRYERIVVSFLLPEKPTQQTCLDVAIVFAVDPVAEVAIASTSRNSVTTRAGSASRSGQPCSLMSSVQPKFRDLRAFIQYDSRARMSAPEAWVSAISRMEY